MPYVLHENATIYWEEHGAGEPLLLIQGLGYSAAMWYRIVPSLAERYRVLAFDNRGVGRSTSQRGRYSMATMAADARAVLQAADVSTAHIFGVSMGGMIAQELALTYPDTVRSLVLGCTSCGGSRAVPAAPIVLGTLVARAKMTPDMGARALNPYIYDAATPKTRIEEDIAVRLGGYPSASTYGAQLKAISAWSSYSRLDSLKAPTLVIHGLSDQLVPPANGRLLAARIREAQLVMLPASHIFWTDQPEASCAAILAFLSEHPLLS